MSNAAWYAMQHLPPGRCRVRVRWEAREFIAVRMLRPNSATQLGWCLPPRQGDTTIDWLPRRADRGRWSPEPECWQPADDRWTWPKGPVPEPLPVHVRPQMYSGDGHRRWSSMVEQAERSDATRARIAAEVAAELGESSPAATATRRIGSRWWRDISLVTYSPFGAVSQEEAEARVCRAVLTDGIRPGELPQGWQGVGTALSQFVAETVTSETHVRLFEPTRADLADYESFQPMIWFAALNPPGMRRRRAPLWELNAAQMVIVLHALGYTWRQAGQHKRLGVSGQRAHDLYHGAKSNVGAIEKVWRAANGQRVLPWLPDHAEDPIAAVRRRNREARNRERGNAF